MPKPILACAALVLLPALAASAAGGEHPRLFITPRDIPRLRHLCGLLGPDQALTDAGPHGRYADDFQLLRMRLSQEFGDVILPGELAGSAFLHVVAPDDPGDDRRLRVIADALAEPPLIGPGPLELALALDWCWADLSYTARQKFLLDFQSQARLLAPGDSPLDAVTFRDKLATLAIAAVVDERDFQSPSWAELRRRIVRAAHDYTRHTLPNFIAWRGGIPTSPATAAQEERDVALLLELLAMLPRSEPEAPATPDSSAPAPDSSAPVPDSFAPAPGEPAPAATPWPTHAPAVGQWLDHYLFTALPHPALRGPFLRDDGDGGAPIPILEYAELQPLTAHLIAARTRAPGAAAVADLTTEALRDASKPGAILWRWVPMLFDLDDVPRADETRLPTARNLDGAVVFRGGGGPTATAVWIDTDQPFLRRGQHFDAGHFIIHAGGVLTPDAGADIDLEAVSAKGGRQRLGAGAETFPFAQFSAASIAHNCMIFADPARVPRWYGRQFIPVGGQRPLEDTCRDFTVAPDQQGRQRSKLIRYGRAGGAAYAAIDLAAAYDPRSVAHYTREFIFLWGRVLVVIDRAEVGNSNVTPFWIAQVPSAPTIDAQPLSPDMQIRGMEPDRGVWSVAPDAWLRWSDRDGSLAMRSLAPSGRAVYVVGGPGTRVPIPRGEYRDRRYVGGGPDTYERLVVPSPRPNADNAWFELGQPTELGPRFGRDPLWGRVEVQGQTGERRFVFVTVLVPNPDDELDATLTSEDPLALRIGLGARRAELTLPGELELGGTMQADAGATVEFPETIQVDPPLPTR